MYCKDTLSLVLKFPLETGFIVRKCFFSRLDICYVYVSVVNYVVNCLQMYNKNK